MPGPDGRWGLGPTPGHRQEGFPGAGSSATLVTGGEGLTEDDPTWSTHPLTPARFEDFASCTSARDSALSAPYAPDHVSHMIRAMPVSKVPRPNVHHPWTKPSRSSGVPGRYGAPRGHGGARQELSGQSSRTGAPPSTTSSGSSVRSVHESCGR